MQQKIQLSMNAAAWFFVGQEGGVDSQKSVPIKTPFRIGRNKDADLCLPCQSVSGTHAEIREEDGQLWLKDLNSTNGTFVNGSRIRTRCQLGENDTVQFGTIVFHVSNDGDAVESSSLPGQLIGREKKGDQLQTERFERLFSGGVVPFFQPVFRIENGSRTVVGYEVLGRSRLFGLRTPAQMFAAASRLEMEAELSRELRNQGIEVADRHLPENQALYVNTHPAELECDGLEESLFEIREKYIHRPIVLEVHETVLNFPEKFTALRTTLQNLDIQLAFHDFGAGKIRLAELCEAVPDVVKFDVKLIKGIDRASSKRQQFVASLVNMATDLGITPLAECVELESEHETLSQLGFQLGQGFFYGRPGAISEYSDCPAEKNGDVIEESAASKNDVQVDAPVPPATPQVKAFLDATNGAADGKTEGNIGATPAANEPTQRPRSRSGNAFLDGRGKNDSRPESGSRPASGNSSSLIQSSSGKAGDAKDAAWLLEQSGHLYTIQVLSAISIDRARDHVAAQSNPEQFAIFCKQGKTRMLYIVVCGLFEDRGAAREASAQHATAAVSPWIRLLSSVHAEINDSEK